MAMDWDRLRVFHAVAEAGSFTHAGDSLNRGVEFGLRFDLGEFRGESHNPYLSFNLTHLSKARFESDLLVPLFDPGAEETEVFQNVRGNRLPYAPEFLASMNLGFEHPAGWNARLGVVHVSGQFSDALNTVSPSPNGQSGRIPAYTVLNASINYNLPAIDATVYLSGTNVTDETYLISRVNGAFAGMPRQVTAGAKIRF